MFDPSDLLLAVALGMVATRLFRSPRRPQAEPLYWSIRPPDSEREIRVEVGMTPGQVADLGRQIVRNADESGAAGDVAFTPPEFRKPIGSLS